MVYRPGHRGWHEDQEPWLLAPRPGTRLDAAVPGGLTLTVSAGGQAGVFRNEAHYSMPELVLRTFRAEGQQAAATIRPPGPAFDDRPSLVRLTAALGAKHQSNVGSLTAGRRARHSHRLRLADSPREPSPRSAYTTMAPQCENVCS